MRIGKDNILGWRRVAGVALTLTALASVASAQLKATVYATGFSLPILMLQDPTSPSRQFVLQQRGLIRVVVNGVVQATNALDLTAVVSTAGDEKGLLGMAFPPNYAATGTAYIYYTTGNTSANTVSWIVKVQRNAINPAIFDAGSRDPIFTISQPFLNHNGGTLRFGPDGMLYFGLGDGGSAGDPSDAPAASPCRQTSQQGWRRSGPRHR